MAKYIAVIGDIKGSKDITNRKIIQKKLKEVLKKINKEYAEDIKLNFTITLGDEFQALLNKPDNLFEIIYKIKFLMPEAEMRFGMGIGEVITEMTGSKHSIGTDGPVWWNARKMVEDLKRYHENNTKLESEMRIKGIENKEIENLINHNFVLTKIIEDKFTKNQKEIINGAIINYGFDLSFSQKDLSEKIGMDAKNLNKSINLAKYYDFIITFKNITKLIEKELE